MISLVRHRLFSARPALNYRSFASSPCRAMKIIPVPVREDNYAYLLVDDSSTPHRAAAIDPYDIPKVQEAAANAGVQVVAAITTHHHFDHSGGNEKFAAAYPGVPIYGGSDKVTAVTNILKDKDEFTIGDDIHIRCLATPCHTQDSICYYATSSAAATPGAVFTGDTLFIAGCGRFFEGTAPEMHAALSYLLTLPADTVVYNGHEYTSGSVAFAASVDGANPAVQRLQALAKEHACTTGLTTIGEEKEWNPFVRLGEDVIKNATGKTEPHDVIDTLRTMKNNFRA